MTSVAEDIRRIYFDLLPSPRAQVAVRRHRVVFSESTGDGTLRHVFGGENLVLLEKSFRQGWFRRWRVMYYEYEPNKGWLVPRGIVLHNRRYNYRLVVKIRDLTWPEDGTVGSDCNHGKSE